jgi:diaminobutyrate-2-oxoglutarate transaminase
VSLLTEVGKLGRSFAFLWLGETAFGFAGALTNFALGAWVFQETGSAQQFSFVALAAMVPVLLSMPLSGGLADRYDRRWVIIGTDAAFALGTLVLVVLLFADRLTIHHLYAYAALGAVAGTLRGPSYQAAVATVLRPETMTRASGLIGMSRGLLQLGAPALAGGLMARAGLRGVLIVQICMVVGGSFAVFNAFYGVAREARSGPGEGERRGLLASTVTSLRDAAGFFRQEPLMLGLLAYRLVRDGLIVMVSTMMTPLVLSNHSTSTLGFIQSFSVAGGLAGSVFLALANSQKSLMTRVIVFDAGIALSIMSLGFQTSPIAWGICAFLATAFAASSEACAMALWMRKTPKACQGSIFSLIGACSMAAAACVLLAGGVVSEHVFEPALRAGGPWTDSIGQWMGTGKGRGQAFLFVVAGAAFLVASIGALAHSGLRHLDELIADDPPLTDGLLPAEPADVAAR